MSFRYSPSSPGNPGRRLWFLSDMHFNHPKLAQKYGMSDRERIEAIIENHNAVVLPGDEVWCLGDVALSWGKRRHQDHIHQLINRLHGNLHLLVGNHDRDEVTSSPRWNKVTHYHELKVDMGTEHKQKIVLCHYPITSWNGKHRGAWHLHGHCHGNLTLKLGRAMDVGVDVYNRLRPLPLMEVAAHMQEVRDLSFDHHTSNEP